MFSKSINDKSNILVALCLEKNLTLTVAESCTGGLFMTALTSIPGVSAIFDGGFVTYSNAQKMKQLNVSEATLANHGAVSDAVVREMAQGAVAATGAGMSIAISGIAGPASDDSEKPVGLVHFGVATSEHAMVTHATFEGLDRNGVRMAAVEFALDLMIKIVDAL